MSQESQELLTSLILLALGPVSREVFVLQLPQKFPSNNLIQACSQAISYKGRRPHTKIYTKAMGDDGCS